MRCLLILTLTYIVLGAAVHSDLGGSDALDLPGTYVKLPLHQAPVRSSLGKRQSDVPVETEDLGLAYFVDGMPPPNLRGCATTC